MLEHIDCESNDRYVSEVIEDGLSNDFVSESLYELDVTMKSSITSTQSASAESNSPLSTSSHSGVL